LPLGSAVKDSHVCYFLYKFSFIVLEGQILTRELEVNEREWWTKTDRGRFSTNSVSYSLVCLSRRFTQSFFYKWDWKPLVSTILSLKLLSIILDHGTLGEPNRRLVNFDFGAWPEDLGWCIENSQIVGRDGAGWYVILTNILKTKAPLPCGGSAMEWLAKHMIISGRVSNPTVLIGKRGHSMARPSVWIRESRLATAFQGFHSFITRDFGILHFCTFCISRTIRMNVDHDVRGGSLGRSLKRATNRLIGPNRPWHSVHLALKCQPETKRAQEP
jgi:hypothetical protein